MNSNCRNCLDTHLHSAYSFDGKEKVSDIVSRAKELGLAAICLTDHCEMNSTDLPEVERNIIRSTEDMDKMQQHVTGETLLLSGVELGQGTQNPEEARRFIQTVDFDFVIGSLHNLAGEEDFYFLKYTQDNASAYLKRYFDELLELVQWGEFDSLGHMTYPLRYMSKQLSTMPDMRLYKAQTDAILTGLVKQGKALEINTSGLRTAYAATYPGLEYVKRFREFGGEMITVGSDAHTLADIGVGIAEGMKIAEAAGFDRVTYYVKRKPLFIELT